MKPLFLLCGVLWSCAARGDVSLPPLFADHIVLQRDKNIAVWGKAAPHEQLAVKLGDKDNLATANTTTGADGNWRISLPAQKAGGPFVLTIKGNNVVEIKDVYIGEVWVASGQSNMQFTLDKATNGEAEVAAANFPLIRQFAASASVASTPQEEVKGNWIVCSPENAKQFSAVTYFFARELHQKLKVPIGVIRASQDWTPGEAWMSREALSADPELKRDVLDRWDEIARLYPQAKKEYDEAMKTWQVEADKAKAEAREAPPQPKYPRDPNFIHRATGLWNGSIAPLIPYAMRGVIWYQGETNDNRGYQYRSLFKSLVTDWRKQWGQGEFPFLYVQLSSILPPDAEPSQSGWAEVREAQSMALSLPNTGMAVTIDIGDEKDVHPKNKQDVGHRLALNALAKVYGQKIEYSGPLYKSMKIEGDKIRLSFDHVNGGLSTPGAALDGFDIAGEDKKFVRAQAKIEGGSVVVWSEGVLKPVVLDLGALIF